jgi:hypothetical protein
MSDEKPLVNAFIRAADAARGAQHAHRPSDVIAMILMEVADKLHNFDAVSAHLKEAWDRMTREHAYPHVQQAASIFLEANELTRLTAISQIMTEQVGRETHGWGWITLDSARQFVGLLGEFSSVRCSFDLAAMPALVAAWIARQADRPCHVLFVNQLQSNNDLVHLASIAIGV